MIYKYSSPQRSTITSPRKVIHTQIVSPKNFHETKITTSKKIIIEGTYDPLQSSINTMNPSSQYYVTKVKSTYVPQEEVVRITKSNSQLSHSPSPSRIVVNGTSNKENDLGYGKGNNVLGGSSHYQISSGIRKVTVPSLFTSKEDIYEGEYNEKGLFDGKGTYYFKRCNVKYQGKFFDGEIHGFGTLSYQNPTNQFLIIYEGGFNHAKKHGAGIYFYGEKNHFYQGEWYNDAKQGSGKYESPQEIYEGHWKNNKKHGEGCLTNKKNNTQFIGKFSDDQFTEGQVRYSNGDMYVGSLSFGKKQGYGTYTYKTRNQQYQGQFSNNLRHGKGTLKLSNGDQFTGNFRHGTIDETMNCSYRWANGNVFNGWFKNSQPDKGTIKDFKENVEYEYSSTGDY